MMTADERQSLKEIVTEVFDERRGIDAALHADHHRYIDDELSCRKRRRDRREKIRQQLTGWFLITLFVSLFSILGYVGKLFYEAFKRGVQS